MENNKEIVKTRADIAKKTHNFLIGIDEKSIEHYIENRVCSVEKKCIARIEYPIFKKPTK